MNDCKSNTNAMNATQQQTNNNFNNCDNCDEESLVFKCQQLLEFVNQTDSKGENLILINSS